MRSSAASDEPGPPDGGAGLVRLRLDLRYDGTDFSGWAAQPGLRTVEGELTAALRRVLRADGPLQVTVAGRTDAGVHASGQVVHVDVPVPAWESVPGRSRRPPHEALARRLAGVLPEDVGVVAVSVAPDGFDARFSALWRRYAYRLTDRPAARDPLRRGFVLAHGWPVDAAVMHAALQPLVGEHDFLPFCRPRPGATTVRRVLELRWDREADGTAVATVVADAFCHHMVRALVGVSLEVGRGRRPPSWPGDLLRGGVRDHAVLVAPAHGLTLEEVRYPPDEALAARARQARAVRMPSPTPGGIVAG